MTNDNQQIYKDLARERLINLEAIAEEIHYWTHGRKLGKETTFIEEYKAEDQEIVKFLQ